MLVDGALNCVPCVSEQEQSEAGIQTARQPP
jgi:hypothetical protein